MSMAIKDQLSPKMRGLLKKVKDQRPVLETGGAALEGMSIQSFRDASIRPKEWEELAEATLAQKGGKGNLLIASGSLFHSLGHVTRSSEVEIGTDRFYAPFLQEGTGSMPARPFIPVSEGGELTPKAADAVRDAIESELMRGVR